MKYLSPVLSISVVFLTILFFSGCSKNNNPTAPSNTTTQVNKIATQDVAYSVASNIAIDNGGMLEEMSDMLKSASIAGIENEDMYGMMNFGHFHSNVTKQYDSTSGWWTITITRQRGILDGFYYANSQRVFQQQFLNKDGQFQKFYITPNGASNDTAYTIKHLIVSGSGVLITPYDSHKLTSLSGAWTITDANKPIMTLNSTTPYMRTVSDTLMKRGGVRTLNGTLTLNFINVTGPRGSGLNWQTKLTGTITGTYHAVVTFSKDTVYTEKTIDRSINIVLGTQTLPVRIKGFNESAWTTFNINTETGDVSEQ